MIVHHIIPLGLEEHALVQMAARGGFDMNALANGKALSQAIHSAGSHELYSGRVSVALNGIWNGMSAADKADPSKAAIAIQSLIDTITTAINNSPNTAIDYLIF